MSSIRRLAGFLRPYWKWVIIAPLLMLVEVMMDLMQPRLLERIVDVGIGQLDMNVVVQTGALMVGIALLGVIGGVGCSVFAVKAAQALGADLRSGLFRKVQSLSFGNLDKLETGQLITRLTNDVTQVQEVVRMMLQILVRGPLMLIGSIVMAYLTSPKLALLLLLLGPLVAGLIILIVKRATPMYVKVQAYLDGLNTVMQESLAGMRVVKAFVRSDHEKDRFGATNDVLTDQSIRVAQLLAIAGPGIMLFINLGVVAVLWAGGILVNRGTMRVGEILAFVNYLSIALREMVMVGMMLMQVSRAQASAERIAEVLDSEPEVQNRPDAIDGFAPQGRVVFEHVTFNYDGEESEPVLRDVTFVAEPGQTVAILGTTGSGKSSLVHLIPRFYDVNEGRVTVDDVDVRDIDKMALRRNIGVALQETVLFSGTVRDNIRYGRPGATDEEVIAAAKAAQAHDFITGLPDGYDTVLGQRGVNLSGGQKQRIAIARALITQPAVLILDDSTSAVDVETEVKIQEALERLMDNRTSFVIAQRISTVLNADKILVLDEGGIAAEGTHRELLASSPIYREIYDSQLGNGVMAYV